MKDFSAYDRRNTFLREMGFKNYTDYLASPLWKPIRARVLARFNHRCHTCPKRATLVHHADYTRENLSGDDTKTLVPLCHDCHQNAEMPNGRKATLAEANIALRIKHKHQRPRRRKAPSWLLIDEAKRLIYDGTRPQRAADGRQFLLINNRPFYLTKPLRLLASSYFSTTPSTIKGRRRS